MSRSISWRTRKRTPCTTQWSCSLLLTTLRSDRSVFPSGRLMSFSSLIRGGGKDNFRCFSSCFEGGLKGGGDFVSYLLSKSSLSILPRLDYKLFLLFFYLNVLRLKLSILKWNTIGCVHWNVFIDPVCVCVCVVSQDMCVVCGSFGQGAEGRLLSCSQCGQCYHPFCVNIKVRPHGVPRIIF